MQKKSNCKIPKIIHYCWFGGNPMPDEYKQNIESWKKYMPDYKIIRWDETNYDYNKSKFTKQAYVEKKWAFLTDYARLDIIYNNGGIYFDTDVEVIKNFDSLLNDSAFMGVEHGGCIATGLGFGAVKGHKALKMNMDYYNTDSVFKDNKLSDNITCPIITTNIFKKHGFKYDEKINTVLDVKIYPTDYFCPIDYITGDTHITQNTYSIHKYSFSWGGKIDKQMLKFYQSKQKNILLKILYPLVNVFYFKPFKYIDKISNYGFKNTIKQTFQKIGGNK